MTWKNWINLQYNHQLTAVWTLVLFVQRIPIPNVPQSFHVEIVCFVTMEANPANRLDVKMFLTSK